MVVENAADAAMHAAMRDIEIILGPFGIAFIDVGAERRAGGAQPRVKGVGVLLIGDRRVEVGTAAKPAFGRREEARVHMHRGDMRVRHMRDKADPRREKARVFAGTVRSEEHTSELQSLMRTSYAVFCLKKK